MTITYLKVIYNNVKKYILFDSDHNGLFRNLFCNNLLHPSDFFKQQNNAIRIRYGIRCLLDGSFSAKHNKGSWAYTIVENVQDVSIAEASDLLIIITSRT